MNRHAEMYVKKDYSIIALAESLKRGGDQRKARFERSLSGMTLELMPQAHGLAGAAIPSVAFARDLEVGSKAGGQAIVSPTVLPVAKAARPATVLEKGGATIVNLNSTSGTDVPIWDGSMTSSVRIGENDPAPQFSGLTVRSVQSSPKCASSRISYSRRLIASVENKAGFEARLLEELRRAIRTQIETAMFDGTGSSSQPLGLLRTSGTGRKTYAGVVQAFSAGLLFKPVLRV